MLTWFVTSCLCDADTNLGSNGSQHSSSILYCGNAVVNTVDLF